MWALRRTCVVGRTSFQVPSGARDGFHSKCSFEQVWIPQPVTELVFESGDRVEVLGCAWFFVWLAGESGEHAEISSARALRPLLGRVAGASRTM